MGLGKEKIPNSLIIRVRDLDSGLPNQGSNLDFTDPESVVLPITPLGTEIGCKNSVFLFHARKKSCFFRERGFFSTFAAMTKPKNKYYVVWQGRHPGIYGDWEVCKREIMGFHDAQYKGFPDRQSAEKALKDGPESYWGKDVVHSIDPVKAMERPVSHAIAVDAACSGNPGKMEYRGVMTETGQELFHSPVFERATNNIGEFLAIVHALALQKKNGWNLPIYSDSVNAQIWVRQRKCKTKLQPDDKNGYLFELIGRAENWLNANRIEVPVLKWKTDIWGEIPADFGRK